jgi:pimeloyl-ACP methyl ester carboxylesterase
MTAILVALAAMPARVTAVGSEGLSTLPCVTATTSRENASFQALPGAKAYFGDYIGGMYRFEVPDAWNGSLVLVMHGTNFGTVMSFGGGSANVFAGRPELRQYFIEKGFAWGASSYQCNGYMPGIGLTNTVLLKEMFENITGKSQTRNYLVGSSMGGFQTHLAMHEFPTMFDGALAMCAINSATWDFQVAAGAAAEYITGLQFNDPATVASVQNQMVAITGVPGSLTQKGIQLASVQIQISGGSRPFAMEGLATPFATASNSFQFNMSGAVFAGSTTVGSLTRGNAGWRYSIAPGLGLTAAELDAGVRRVSPNPDLWQAFPETRPLTGLIERPVMTLHTTGDMVVPILNQQVLQRAVDAAGRSNLLVQRIIRAPGHCTFSGQEQIQAFADLALWVETGVRPQGDNVLADLSDAGRKFTNPLRPGDPGGIAAPTSPQ